MSAVPRQRLAADLVFQAAGLLPASPFIVRAELGLGDPEGVGDALVAGIILPVDAVGVDL